MLTIFSLTFHHLQFFLSLLYIFALVNGVGSLLGLPFRLRRAFFMEKRVISTIFFSNWIKY